MNISICFVFVNIILSCTVDGCLLPLTEGSWYSTSRGTWIVTNNASKSYIQNFEARITPQKAHTLECINNTDTKYIFRTTIHIFLQVLDIYTCFDITQERSSPDIFVFYIVTPPDGSGERFSARQQDICNHSDYKTAVNAHLIIRPGFEIASTIRCPDVLNGIFDVAFENGDGNNTNDIEMDSCIDVKRMVFTNLSPKSTHGFTNGNILHCLYSATSGTRVYLHTYNNDSSVDNVNTFRFACWVIERDRNQTKATVFPNKCVSEQNATSVPPGGQTFVFTSKGTCDQESFGTQTTLVTPDAPSSNTTREQTSHSWNVKPSRIFVPFCLAYFIGIIFKYTGLY